MTTERSELVKLIELAMAKVEDAVASGDSKEAVVGYRVASRGSTECHVYDRHSEYLGRNNYDRCNV